VSNQNLKNILDGIIPLSIYLQNLLGRMSDKQEKKETKKEKKMEFLQNYSTSEHKADLGLDLFAPYKKKLETLYTDRKKFAVSFDIVNINCAIANAIRRTIMGELEIKALTFDVSTIKTNVDFLITDELLDRIQLLPIRQTIPMDSKLSVSAVNKGTTIQTLYSASIEGKENTAISKRFRLAELRQGNFLHIPEIRVVSGKGKDHAMFSLTNEYAYDTLDYMDCHVLNAKGNRLKKRVSVRQLYRLINPSKKEKEEDVAALRKLKYEKVLVIPNKAFEAKTENDEKVRIEKAKYDHILINPAEDPDANDTNAYLPEQSSFIADPKEFRMTFYISAQIEPDQLLPMALESLLERLMKIQSSLTTENGSVKVYTKPVSLRHGAESTTVDQWHMTIMGETHTIGQLLVRGIYDLDPDIPFVGQHMDHPKDNRVTIRIIHPEAPKLMKDALASLIRIFEKIKQEAHLASH
jgi:DNA-directed RNA polymerase subunit L